MTPSAKKEVRVRFAPSPTGPLHVGGARTALVNWLFARQRGGKFILRIEDTDRERSEKRYEQELMEALAWLGIMWDEGPVLAKKEEERGKSAGRKEGNGYIGDFGPYRQSERTEIYKKYLRQLLTERKAYYCYCTKEELESERQVLAAQGLAPKYGGHCRTIKVSPPGREPQVIRFRTPGAIVAFKDLIRGKVQFDAALIGDIPIAKNEESPLYNFAAVVDDFEMRVSHVIRGEEHLSNTPKQVLLTHALGFDEPTFAHLPLILSPDRSKLSKRHADVSVLSYRRDGYLPEGLVNFMALLGWHPHGNEEIFTLDELLKVFEIERVQKAGAIFNQEKLDWLNARHLRRLAPSEIALRLRATSDGRLRGVSDEFLSRVVAVERERATTLNDIVELGSFFFELPDYEPQLLSWRRAPFSEVRSTLEAVLERLEALADSHYSHEELFSALKELIAERGRGVVLWPLRVAVSGKSASPGPFEIIEIIGREETLRRIRLAIRKLDQGRLI